MLTAAILGDWSWTSVALGIGAILVGIYIPTLRTWIAGGLGKNKETPTPITTDFTPVVDRNDPVVTSADLADFESAVNKKLSMFAADVSKSLREVEAKIRENPNMPDFTNDDPRLKLSAALILLTDHCVATGDTEAVAHCEALAKTVIKQPGEKKDAT